MIVAGIASFAPHVVVLLVTTIWSPTGEPTIQTYTNPKLTISDCQKLAREFRQEMTTLNLEDAPESGLAFYQPFNSHCDVIPSKPNPENDDNDIE